jgi:DNA-directed RNA polymerase subunit RPC12/RpoP
MFNDDGLWPCQCSACGHEWYSSIAAIRADAEVACSACGIRTAVAEFNSALVAARTGRYDFSYLVHITPHFRSRAAPFGRSAESGLTQPA